MSHSTAPSMCPCSWASLLTSTSTTRTVGSSRWASSHSGSARTPAPGSRVGAFFSGAVVIVVSSGSLILDCSSFAVLRRPGQSFGGGCGEPGQEPGQQLVDGGRLLHVDH